MSADELAKTDYMGETLTIGQLKTRLYFAEMSQSSLIRKLEKVTKVSRSRLKRMNQRGKLVIDMRAELLRLQEEAHGG